MRIWHISDTHEYHNWFEIPENIDIVVHSGDATNSKNPTKNAKKMKEFMEWFSGLPIKHKVFVPGNHDSSIEAGIFDKEDFSDAGIHLLHNSSVKIEGKLFWGSAHCPMYCNWSFMLEKEDMPAIWAEIPEGVDVLVTHTPPRNILDLTHNHDGSIDVCGCPSLWSRVVELQPKLHLFGHIHNSGEIQNTGTKTVPYVKTVFSNGSCCVDRQFGKIFHPGNILDLE